MATGVSDDSDAKRNLVVDEAAFEEQFLRCHICREKFDLTDKTPKSLPCNHTFCLPCLKQVFDHNQQNTRRSFTWADDSYEGVLKCPTCRIEIFLSRGEITALPNDHRVIQMIDFLSQVVVKAQNICTKHENQPLNFFCRSCLVPVCRDCTVLDHKEQDEHTIVDVAQALKDNSDEFNNTENRSKQLLQNMKTRSDALANGSKRLDLLERQLRGTIKDTFIEYRLLLERRQEAHIGILHEYIKTQKSLINSRFVEVCTQGSQLQKLYDSFTKARPSNDITRLFNAHKEMKAKEAEYADQADVNDDDLFVGCTFTVENEGLFFAEMSGLGEVNQAPDLELKQPVPAHQLVVLDMEERRKQEASQGPDPIDCDDLMVTGVESGASNYRTAGSRSRRERANAERLVERATRLRARERDIGAQLNAHVDDTYEMDHESSDAVTSSYLLRIASRLSDSSANLSEAIMDLSADTAIDDSPDDVPTSSSGTQNTSRGTRLRRSGQPARVVRQPQQGQERTEDRYTSQRYTSNGEQRH